MKIKGQAAEAFCKAPKPDIRLALLFGRDSGQISDGAASLAKAWANSRTCEIVRLSEDEVKRDPARLMDELEAQPLFGEEERLIRLQIGGEVLSKTLLDVLQLCDKTSIAPLVVEAGDLAPRSRIRQGFENAKNAVALHFYADQPQQMRAYVEAALSKSNVSLTPEALDMFCAELPGQRGLANAEIEKLSLYAIGLERAIEHADISALTPGQASDQLSDLINAVLEGALAASYDKTDRLFEAGQTPIGALRGLQFEIQRLLFAHGGMEGGESLAQIAPRLRPRLFESQFSTFRDRLKLWSPKRLIRALDRIYECEKTCKQAGAPQNLLTRKLFADLAGAAASAKSRAGF